MNATARHVAEKPVNISVYATFSVNGCDTSLYLGMTQYKPRDKITQKMSRDGLLSENQTTGETERISKREQEADLQKTPEQQAAQDAAQFNPISGDASAATRLPGLSNKTDTGTAERIINRVDAGLTRKASKKAAQKAQQEATAREKSSRLLTDKR